jgi:hypothetical protein
MLPHLIGRRGPGRAVIAGDTGGSGGVSDGGFVDQPVATTTASGNTTIKGKVKAGSFGKFVYPLATIAAGRQYTFRYTPQFSQLAQQGKLAMVGFGLKNNNDFHIVGLRGDGSTGLHKYEVYGTPPNGWNAQTGHTTSDGGASANGTQAGPNWIRLVVSADGATYKFQTSSDGSTWTDEFTGVTPSPFSNVSSVTTFGIALWFNNADAGPFSIVIDQFADAAAPVGFTSTITIASGNVSSDLTNFPVRVNLADMPSGFWSAVKSDGGDIRAYAADGTTQLPFDLTVFDKTGNTGELFVKMNVATASNTVFKIKYGDSSLNLLPATDTYGRNAVWADYDVVIINGLTNRNGSGHDAAISGTGVSFASNGWAHLINATGYLYVTGLTKRTTWTAGASSNPSASGSNMSMVSYTDNSSDSSNRATLLDRGATNNYGIWNSTDSWLDSSDGGQVNGLHRGHEIYNGTTYRKVYKDGVLRGTHNGNAARPGANGDAFVIGSGTPVGGNEIFQGDLGLIYLRNGELSAAWLAAEYASWAQTGFYSVS